MLLIKVPPAFKVPPEPLNVIAELDPAVVIFPEAVTDPVEMVIVVERAAVVLVPPNAMVEQDSEPEPTANATAAADGRDMDTAPVETVCPLKSRVVLVEVVGEEIPVVAVTSPVKVVVPPVLLIVRVPVFENAPILCEFAPVNVTPAVPEIVVLRLLLLTRL